MVSLMQDACNVMMHDVMIETHHKYPQISNMVKVHKSHREPLDFRLARSLGTTLFQFSWYKPVLKIVTGF